MARQFPASRWRQGLSAIRWAPGAANYFRDVIDMSEERGWSWHVEYNETMTSDANRLTLKTYFDRNAFLAPVGVPADPVNLVQNGRFEKDFNMDGLADAWGKDPQAVASLMKIEDPTAQRVTTQLNGRGIDQAYFTVSDQNRYRMSAKIRVISGKINFLHKDYTSNTVYAGSGSAAANLQDHRLFLERKQVAP